MSSALGLILVFLALALIISAGVAMPRSSREDSGQEPVKNGDGQVESELLRRPLRSRHPV